MNIYEAVKQALQDVVAPEIRELRTEIRRLDEKIDSTAAKTDTRLKSLDEKIDSTAAKTETRFKQLDEKIDSTRDMLLAEIRRLDEKLETGLEFRERFAALEAKVAVLTGSSGR